MQNTYIDLAPGRTALEINLTPGVLVAPRVVALIDADEDGAFSEAESDAYANTMLRDIATLVAAYLIDSRGAVKHAAVLGGIVTHTASVIAVGLLALLAS